MKALIIGEKPSLARNVIQAISKREKFERKEGYYESKSYIVSWAVGHLLELKSISDYEGRKVPWKDIPLPYIPEKFEFKVKEDTKGQFKILKTLIHRNDVGEIFNCGDPDREGEVIINNILSEVNNKKNVYRLWLKDQEEKTILESLDRKESDKNYENLYAEGIARTILDWILGINETVYLSNRSGILLRAGRILIPIVKKVYDRDMEIKNFIPKTYYQSESNIDNIKLTFSKKYDSKEGCEVKTNELNNNKTIVEDITTKDVKKQPSKLFNLTSLQKYMNKNYKMSADQVLKIVQTLYENKYATYPRTDCEYMTTDEKSKAKSIISALNDNNLEFKDKKTIFVDSGEAHSAITPTTKIATELVGNEKIVYDVIVARFKANFCKEDCIISETNIVLKNGNDEFKLTGKAIKQEGFLKYEPSNNEKMIPSLSKGQEIETEFKTVEKETKPPKKLSEADLLSYLEHPFRKEDENSENENNEDINVKEIGLGTPATRATIISNAKKMEYIISEKNVLSVGMIGIQLIELIDKLKIDLYADKTIKFSIDIKKVNEGKLSINDCIENVKKEINEVISNGQNVQIDKFQKERVEREVIGKCPKCKKNIYQSTKGFYCEGFKDDPKCNFFVGNDNKFFTMRGKKVTKTIMKNLLKDGQANVKDFKKKDGSGTYDAKVLFDFSNEKYINFSLDFKK